MVNEPNHGHGKRGTWKHAGGKLRELGADNLSERELLAIIISSGMRGKPAEMIADEILSRFGSFRGMANQPLEKFLEIKGIGDVRTIRIAATFEIARRCVEYIIDQLRKDETLRKKVFNEGGHEQVRREKG